MATDRIDAVNEAAAATALRKRALEEAEAALAETKARYRTGKRLASAYEAERYARQSHAQAGRSHDASVLAALVADLAERAEVQTAAGSAAKRGHGVVDESARELRVAVLAWVDAESAAKRALGNCYASAPDYDDEASSTYRAGVGSRHEALDGLQAARRAFIRAYADLPTHEQEQFMAGPEVVAELRDAAEEASQEHERKLAKAVQQSMLPITDRHAAVVRLRRRVRLAARWLAADYHASSGANTTRTRRCRRLWLELARQASEHGRALQELDAAERCLSAEVEELVESIATATEPA